MPVNITCPSCAHQIETEAEEGEMQVGDYFECETCFEELVITSLKPLKVEVVEDEK